MKKQFAFIAMLLLANHVNGHELEQHKQKIEEYKNQLNHAYQELVKMDKENLTLDAFKTSQTLWNKFIKEDCKFMNSPMSMAQGEGYIVTYYECLEEAYQNRIKQVNQMISELK